MKNALHLIQRRIITTVAVTKKQPYPTNSQFDIMLHF